MELSNLIKMFNGNEGLSLSPVDVGHDWFYVAMQEGRKPERLDSAQECQSVMEWNSCTFHSCCYSCYESTTTTSTAGFGWLVGGCNRCGNRR